MSPKVRRIRKGDPITAQWCNDLVDASNRSRITVAQSGGLGMTQTSDGTVLWNTRLFDGGSAIARVTTAIPTGSLSSPSTSGRITIQTWDPDAGEFADDETLEDLRVVNIFEIPASIPTDAGVLVTEWQGDYFLVQASCPTE